MIHNLRFLPEVEDDVIAGYSWYEEKAKGLGEEFIRGFLCACRRDSPPSSTLSMGVPVQIKDD